MVICQLMGPFSKTKEVCEDRVIPDEGDEFNGQINQIITYTKDYMHPELDKDCPELLEMQNLNVCKLDKKL